MHYLKLIDTLYLFNDNNGIVYQYTIDNSGFTYSVTCYPFDKYRHFKQMIEFNVLTEVFTEKQFIDFSNLLADIDNNSNTLTPLIDFETQIQAIRDKYNIYMRKM